MAQRRMFSLKIIDTDAFLDMPASTQLLYFHLSMRADDDGFISSPNKIMKMVSSSEDDFKILKIKQYIIPFESGICVVRHWRIHNYIQKDRYNETLYLNEKKALIEKNGVYEISNKIPMDTQCIHNVSKEDTQVRLELGKERINNMDICSDKSPPEIEKNKYNEQKKEKTNTLYDNYFEKLWGYYPKKRGKSKVSKKQKKKLYTDIGFENMKKAIEKYLVEVKDREEKYIMYGSTFFNSGYMDYLPKEKDEKSIQNKKPKRTLYLNEQSKNKIYQLQEELKEGIISTQEYKKKTEEIIQDQTEGGE